METLRRAEVAIYKDTNKGTINKVLKLGEFDEDEDIQMFFSRVVKELAEILPGEGVSDFMRTSANCESPQSTDDYDTNMHSHWKDEPKDKDDGHGGTIKHFQ